MRTLWRALPALLVGATLLAPVSPAAASESCSFYRWDEPAREWVLVKRLYPRKEFKETYVHGVDWHCEYCVPMIKVRDPDDVFEQVGVPQPAHELVEETVETLAAVELPVPSPGPVSPAGVDPWNGPACPDVPPVWDEEALDAVGGIF